MHGHGQAVEAEGVVCAGVLSFDAILLTIDLVVNIVSRFQRNIFGHQLFNIQI